MLRMLLSVVWKPRQSIQIGIFFYLNAYQHLKKKPQISEMLFLFTETVSSVFPSLFVCPLIFFKREVYTNFLNSDVKFFGFQFFWISFGTQIRISLSHINIGRVQRKSEQLRKFAWVTLLEVPTHLNKCKGTPFFVKYQRLERIVKKTKSIFFEGELLPFTLLNSFVFQQEKT